MPSIAAGFTSTGGNHRGEAARDRLLHRHVDQRELEQRADAGQVEEARAGHLCGALDVDRAEQLAELDVVARLEALGGKVTRRADLLDQDEVLFAAAGTPSIDHVGQLHHQGVDSLGRARAARLRPP